MFRVVFLVLIGFAFFGCSKVDKYSINPASEYVTNEDVNYLFDKDTVTKIDKDNLIKIVKIRFGPDERYLYLFNNQGNTEIFDMEMGILEVKNSSPTSNNEEKDFIFYEDKDWKVSSGLLSMNMKTERGEATMNLFSVELKPIPQTKENLTKTTVAEMYQIIGLTKDKLSNKKIKVLINNDGSVSLYSIETDKKLVTIKLFTNQNRGAILGEKYENRNSDSWLAITPEGYYVGSDDAYKYLDVDKYYEKFYRPEIVKLALQGNPIENLPSVHDIKSPPTVEILNGLEETDKESIEIKVAVTAQSGGVGKIQVFRNGTSIAFETRAFRRQQKDNIRTYKIQLLKGANEIKAVAFDSTNSVRSESSLYTIRSTYIEPHKKSIYALVIGIEKFDNGRFDLENTISDAKLFTKTLKSQENNGLFHDVKVVTLTSKEETTKENILNELKKMKSIHPEDLFVLYVGSHGEVNDDGKYYLIPSNIEDDSSESIKKYAISDDDIKELVGNIPTAQKFIVFDTCKAGSIAGTLTALETLKQNMGVDDKTALATLSHSIGKGAMIMGASTAKEVANEKYKEHGLFTYVLVEGLTGEAEKNGEPNIQSSELKNYVYKNVKEISSNLKSMPTQTPIINDIGEPFSISRGR